ncbi:helix-turn-helix domain-containing protein [Streptomyces sp. NPDC001985]|uniref:helix-turn-helix transcriptional regulator n=1 Tax=Streptomyces sp. NPDC001985 TaxID=3154406 RepID=UPI00332A2762
MTWNWPALGNHLQAAREARRMTQPQLADRVGVSLSTVQSVEAGKPFAKVTPTIRAMARIVGWTEDSPEAVLAGEEPSYVEDYPRAGGDEPPQEEQETPALPPLIAEELREGQILGSGVYDLTQEGSSAQLIVIVKGPSDATPEDMRRYAQAWRQKDRALRKLESGEGDSTS